MGAVKRGDRPTPHQDAVADACGVDQRTDAMNEAPSPGEAQGRPVLNTQKPFGRTRPTNNQLL